MFLPATFYCLLCGILFLSGILGKGIKCSMKSYKLSELNQDAVTGLKARPRIDFSSIFGVVSFRFFTVFLFISWSCNFNLQFQFKTSDFKFYV